MVRLREMLGSVATKPRNGHAAAVVDKSDTPTVTIVTGSGGEQPDPSKVTRAAEAAEEEVRQLTGEIARLRMETDAVLTAAEQCKKDAVTTVRAELEVELVRATAGRDKEHAEQLRQLREAVDGLFVRLTPEG